MTLFSTSTVSGDIAQLAAQLIAKQRGPVQTLQTQRNALSQRSSVLGTLRTKLLALQSSLDNLTRTGSLSPFAANAASSSDTTILTASASTTATPATVSMAVSQLAKAATHVSDLYTDTGTTVSTAGAGTFAFTVTIGGTAHAVSVTVNPGDTDKTVLDNMASAINTAAGTAGSAVRIQTATGQSRLSIASALSGTANKLTFTDTDGLLARVGIYHAVATAATDTTGGYIYEDLGGHELDATLAVNGVTLYRDSNTVTDAISGVTLDLKNHSATSVTVKIQPDADSALTSIRDFITKYNDVIDYLGQNTAVDPKAGTRGALALDSVFSMLSGQLRSKEASIVGSQPAGVANSLGALGIKAASDGKLSIADETALRNSFIANPSAVTTLFTAADGVGTVLDTFVKTYSSYSGHIVTTQNQLSLRTDNLDHQIDRMNAVLARRQAQLEQQLAQGQALLQRLSAQASQMSQITSILTAGYGSTLTR